jgi:hypothetical protein
MDNSKVTFLENKDDGAYRHHTQDRWYATEDRGPGEGGLDNEAQ